MSSWISHEKDCIVVAVANDPNAVPLARFAEMLATKLGKRLHFAHVPSQDQPQMPLALARNTTIAMLAKASKAEAVASARARLDELVGLVRAEVQASAEMRPGTRTEDVLSSIAREQNACLIVTSTSRESYKFTPKGFSTALGLMAKSPLPVIVVPRDAELAPEESRGLRLVVADSLEDESKSAVAFALEVARAWRDSVVRHVYVRPASLGALFDVATNQANAAWASAAQKLRVELENRSAEWLAGLIGSGGRYQPEVLAGSATDELGDVASRMAADLVVFGRHKPITFTPFRIGRMPFHAMLSYKGAIAVVPPE